MNDLIYAGVVLAGAITLLIEAYRNYNTSLSSIAFKEYPILQDVSISKLCTPREKNIGFAFFSLLYLTAYIIILSSTEVYELVTQAAQSTLEVGPATAALSLNDDPINFINTQYGKPIFISAAIIAIFSIGVLRPIEETMRSLAHRIAGIPRGVYNVIQELHSIEYKAFNYGEPTPLKELFDKNMQESFAASIDRDLISSIEHSLLTIDYLAPTITGQKRTQHFPLTQLDAMRELSVALDAQIQHLKDLIMNSEDVDDARRREIYHEATSAANDTIALFAVHFMRNSKAIKNLALDSALSKIYKKIKQNYQVELNSFTASIILAVVTASLCTVFVKTVWNTAEAPINANLIFQIEARKLSSGDESFTGLSTPECRDVPLKFADEYFDAHEEGQSYDQSDNYDSVLSGNAEDNIKKWEKNCSKYWESAIQDVKAERFQGIVVSSFWSTISIIFAVSCAVLSTVFGWDIRQEDNSWPVWQVRRTPFLRLFSMTIIPGMLAVLGICLGDFLNLWRESGFHLTESAIAFFFDSNAHYFPMYFGLGVILSFSVLFLVDQHKRKFFEETLLFAAFFAILVFGWACVTVVVGYPSEFLFARPHNLPAFFRFEVREAIVIGSGPAFFVLFFAFFLEITEDDKGTDDELRKRGSYILKKIIPHKAKTSEKTVSGN